MKLVNDCNCLYDEKLLIKAMLWFGGKSKYKFKHVYMHGRYPAVSIYKKKIHIHRLLLMFKFKRILERSEYSHHKDRNVLNAYMNNIEMMGAPLHQSLHRKNVKLSKEHKRKIGVANKRRRWIRQNGRFYKLIHEEAK